jgi:DNA-binding YbaB/EbfC family protein
MKGMDFNKMLKQAQQMQKKMEDTQNELATIEMTGVSGGGAVEVRFNGKNEFLSIKIKPEAINPENPSAVDEETIEMLEDLISSAIKDATIKVNNTVQQKMSSINFSITNQIWRDFGLLNNNDANKTTRNKLYNLFEEGAL